MENTAFNKAIVYYGQDEALKLEKAKELAGYEKNPNDVFIVDCSKMNVRNTRFLFSGLEKCSTLIATNIDNGDDLMFMVLGTCQSFHIEKKGERPFRYQPQRIIITLSEKYTNDHIEAMIAAGELGSSTLRRCVFFEA